MKSENDEVDMVQKFIMACAIMICLCSSHYGMAQEVEVRVSYDSLYIGNTLAVQFYMKDWQGDLEKPDFGDFIFAGGPQISSSTSISQGKRSSEKTILFYVKSPENPGSYSFPPQKFVGEGATIQSKAVTIEVLPNPENIQQRPVITEEESPAHRRFTPGRNQAPTRGNRRKF